MNLFKINQKYKIVLKIGNELSYYTIIVIEEDSTHFRFKDKFKKEFIFSKDLIKSVREINNDETY
ncbi:MAG: hypothetical protein WC758_07885 [Candidatus Woesearchaeota archaeon]|jgi:hypothetical protein